MNGQPSVGAPQGKITQFFGGQAVQPGGMINGLSGGQKATPSWNLQNNLASGGGQGSKPQVLNAFGQGGVVGGGGGFGARSGGNQTVQGSTNGFGSGNSGANGFGNTFGNGGQANDQNNGSFA